MGNQMYSGWPNGSFLQQPYMPCSTMLSGRVINDISEIRPQDVPMDGSPAIFPLKDGNTICVKYWDKNCNLCTDKYSLIKEQQVEQVNETVAKDPLETILERLDQLEKKVEVSSKQNRQPKKTGGED